MNPLIDVIIPAFNEADAIEKVIKDIPKNLVREIIVVNNNSTDKTATVSESAGATVISEINKGYGYSCLKGILYLSNKNIPPDIVVFLDGDYSDFPNEMNLLIQPIIEENYDLVIGSRKLGDKENGSMTIQQIFGNWLATILLKILYQSNFTDLGPFRAIKWGALQQLNMQDTTYGWTVEMQLKAAKMKLKYCEVPVSYRKRIGQSKISGTINGTIMAGYKIISTILKYL